MAGKGLRSVDFEVFGKVQGVFFRKHTRINAGKHSLVGWCLVVSCLFSRKRWLKETGSPKSRIDRCEFKNERTITKLEFSDFTIRK
ncbi:unnamed protein product [Porites evermanni]|uniref:acylphosphatase n=1 Tax=Porites evermanni TaxID=104178 RepID=A0ABN8LIR0_9CNID|nr:unnamed protein product [Porites evermanni]